MHAIRLLRALEIAQLHEAARAGPKRSFKLESAATAIRAHALDVRVHINVDVRASAPRAAEQLTALRLLLAVLAGGNVFEPVVVVGDEVLICHDWPPLSYDSSRNDSLRIKTSAQLLIRHGSMCIHCLGATGAIVAVNG